MIGMCIVLVVLNLVLSVRERTRMRELDELEQHRELEQRRRLAERASIRVLPEPSQRSRVARSCFNFH